MSMMKCPKCKQDREIEAFTSLRSSKVTKSCRTCLDKAIGRSLTEDTKNKRKQYQRDYYLNIFKPKFKTYYEANKDKYMEHSKKHYLKITSDGPIVFETTNCPCGGRYKSPARIKHSQTNKHQKWLNEQKVEDEVDSETSTEVEEDRMPKKIASLEIEG